MVNRARSSLAVRHEYFVRFCVEWGDWHVFESDDEQGDIVRPSLRLFLRNASGGYDARDTSDRFDKVKHGRTAPMVTGLGLAGVRIPACRRHIVGAQGTPVARTASIRCNRMLSPFPTAQPKACSPCGHARHQQYGTQRSPTNVGIHISERRLGVLPLRRRWMTS